MTEQRLPVDRFSSVGLDELVAEASLMTRIDRKYLVPHADAVRLLGRLDPNTRVLEIDGLRKFFYDSVYFDTPDRLSYRSTALRRRRRFKLRTRSYVDTGGTFLELKTKSGRGATVKDRMPYLPDDSSRLTAVGRRFVGARLAELGYDLGITETLCPSLVSRYQRITLLLPCGSRATIDTALHWSTPHSARLPTTVTPHPNPTVTRTECPESPGFSKIELPEFTIIESKSSHRASSWDSELWRSGHRPNSISKFGTGTAALHPELPANKWSRALRGPFTTAQRTTARS
ncbi:polyphosphate polymerase domain-containing protein [Leucobacter sp. GX24907]